MFTIKEHMYTRLLISKTYLKKKKKIGCNVSPRLRRKVAFDLSNVYKLYTCIMYIIIYVRIIKTLVCGQIIGLDSTLMYKIISNERFSFVMIRIMHSKLSHT